MSTIHPRDQHSLRIVDQETGAELAQLGMEIRRRARSCRECRFFMPNRYPYDPLEDQCAAYTGAQCKKKNPNADCELWEAKLPVVALSGMGGLLLGTTFGGAVVGLLWLLLGGG